MASDASDTSGASEAVGESGWIGETFTSDAGWDHLERLVDIGNRMAGQPGEREGLAATRDALADAGCRNVRIEEFPLQGWVRGDASIATAFGDQSCIALPRSPAGEASGELVDVGAGLPEEFAEADLAGKVALVSTTVPDWYERFIHRREKYYHAVEAGASAFVFRNHVEGQLPPTGSVGTEDAPIGDVPAVGVSAEVGGRLARRATGETVTVSVDCETPDATSGNVHAELGPETDEQVLVTCHVDAHDIAEGAMDNGAGTATLVEIAHALARRGGLDTRVHFVACGAEEVGLIGSTVASDRIDHDSIRAVVNVDSNVAGRTLGISTHGFPALEAAVERVADRFDHPVESKPELVPHSDHWPFVRHGVPGYMISGVTEGRGRGFGHTEADTFEKLESRNLREQAILLTALTAEVAADATVSHRSEAGIAADLEAAGQAEGMKITGDWPYDD
ncbi:MAG: M28 family peptidase [Halobaculum sp.]